MNHRLRRMLTMILDESPNPWAAIFALRLLMSPKKVRDEWHRVGYRFPWQKAVTSPFRTERERWVYGSGKDTLNSSVSGRADSALDDLRAKAREPHRGWVHVDDIEAILAQVNEYEQRLRALENIARHLNEALPKGDDWKDAMAVGYKLSGRTVLGLGYALEGLYGLHGVDEDWASALLAPAAAPAVSPAAAGGAETEQP